VQVRAFVADRGLAWRRDRSNFDLGLRRARVRLGLLPTLARELNPRLARSLARLADVQRDEERLLDRLAARVGPARPPLDVGALAALEPALARRAVRLWWRRQGGDRRLGFGHVEAVLHLVRRPQDGIARVPGGVIERVGGALRVGSDGRATPAATAPYALTLAPGASVETPSGWHLTLREAAPGQATPGDAVCVLDADHVVGDLRVRNRRPGDRLRLHGLGGRTSIKRLFITRRVPRAAREGYPLVLVGEAILWVPRCGRSDVALVSATTARVLVVEATPRIGASE
jgi:tRNA(Ile)-lysidine synthase